MWFILSLIIAVWGVSIIGAGRRGPRVDDHPLCRRCGFDLAGVLRPGMTRAQRRSLRCPECGAALGRPGTLMIGNRVRRPGMIRLGAVVVVIGVLGMAWPVATLMSPELLARTLPDSPLAWRAREGDVFALRELARRVAAGTTSAELTRALAAHALEMQRTSTPQEWASRWEWGQMIEFARARSLLGDAQWTQYARQGMADLKARVTASQGPSFEVVFSADTRFGRPVWGGPALGGPGAAWPRPIVEIQVKLESYWLGNATGSFWESIPFQARGSGTWRVLTDSDHTGFSLAVGTGRAVATGSPARVITAWSFRAVEPLSGTVVGEWRETFDRELPRGQ